MGVEKADDAISGSDDRVVLSGVLQRIGYDNYLTNHLDSERRVTRGEVRIRKRAGKRHSSEPGKECLDESIVEIRDR